MLVVTNTECLKDHNKTRAYNLYYCLFICLFKCTIMYAANKAETEQSRSLESYSVCKHA